MADPQQSDKPSTPMPRTFEYLMNAMETAAQRAFPADHGYAEKRSAVFQHVKDLWDDYIRLLRDKQDRLEAPRSAGGDISLDRALHPEHYPPLPSARSHDQHSIPIDMSMVLNAKEAEKVGMERITISVPIKDILYASPTVSATLRIPDGWALVPADLTAENGMKYHLSGDWSVRVDEEGHEVVIPWDTIKQIHREIVERSQRLLPSERTADK